jgi:hypothetical protein
MSDNAKTLRKKKRLKIDHIMFPVYNNNNFLEHVYKTWIKVNKQCNIGEQNSMYKGVYYPTNNFYVEHLSTTQGEKYWSNSIYVILKTKYWSYFINPDSISEYFLIPKFGCGYHIISPNYPHLNRLSKSNDEQLKVHISKALMVEIENLCGFKWEVPNFIRVNDKLLHNYDIAVINSDDRLIAPLFQSNFALENKDIDD